MPEFTGARPPQPVLIWTRGEELPPFEKFNAEAVSLALDLAAGRASLPAPVPLSNGLAVQVYQLFCDKERRAESCENCTFQDVHRALSALHFGAPEPLLDCIALRNALLRSGQRLLGLFHKLKHDLKFRGRIKELKDMSYDEARAYESAEEVGHGAARCCWRGWWWRSWRRCCWHRLGGAACA